MSLEAKTATRPVSAAAPANLYLLPPPGQRG